MTRAIDVVCGKLIDRGEINLEITGDYPEYHGGKHPEQQDDELFLTNHSHGHIGSTYRTLRIGRFAYTTDFMPWRGGRPIFVKREEFLNRGLKPKSEWSVF